MLQIRPTEIKAVADLLMQEHDDVETLAKLVIQTIDELRAKRTLFALVEIQPTLGYAKAIGPYNTDGQALKDQGLLTRYDEHTIAVLAKLVDPATILTG